MASLVSDLRDAISDGDIRPFFQPQFDLATGRVVGLEALARWDHPERGAVSPAEFVPVAQASGLVHQLGLRMLDAACIELRAWRGAGQQVELAVNVSPTELTDPFFCTDVLSVLAKHGIRPDEVTLEFTETEPFPDESAAIDALARLRDAGLRISLDDYGTGAWVFEQLDQLQARELKLDRSLIQHGFTPGLADLVERAHLAGARVVAEGVETAEDLETARRLGCDRAQGFLLGMPVPPDRVPDHFV